MAYTTITANVGKDPELKQSNQGKSFARFSVAWSERSKDRAGEWVDGPVIWVSVTCFGRMAENVCASISKGMQVDVTGHLKAESWASDQGEQTMFTMVADKVAPALTFQVAKVARANQQQGGNTFQNQQPQQQGQGGWGGQQQSQGGFGQGDDEPFF